MLNEFPNESDKYLFFKGATTRKMAEIVMGDKHFTDMGIPLGSIIIAVQLLIFVPPVELQKLHVDLGTLYDRIFIKNTSDYQFADGDSDRWAQRQSPIDSLKANDRRTQGLRTAVMIVMMREPRERPIDMPPMIMSFGVPYLADYLAGL